MWLLLALACTDPAVEASRLLDANALYETHGALVAPLPRGEPLRPWPQVIVQPAGVRVDLRPAWYAAAAPAGEGPPEPTQVLRGLDREARAEIQEAARDAYDQLDAGRELGLDTSGVNVLLDERLTAREAWTGLYVAGQASARLQLVGREGDRLRGAQDFPAGAKRRLASARVSSMASAKPRTSRPRRRS